MLSKETFCEALRKIQAQKDRDEQFSKALAMMGDGHFVFEGGALVLAALLDVLRKRSTTSTTISAGGFTRPPQATKSGPMMKKPSGA